MIKIKLLIFTLTVLLLNTSCVSNRKIALMKKNIEVKKDEEQKLNAKIASLDAFRVSKSSLGELDDVSNGAIEKALEKEKSGIMQRMDSLDKMDKMLSGKRVKIKDFKNMVSVITIANTVISQKSESVNFVDQLLKQQTFIKFNTAAFFKAGGYKIPEDKFAEAKMVFSPIVDSLIVFVKKFPNYKLNSSIIASGYADGQGFGAGELVDELTLKIGKEVATKEELNSELSRLRAEEVISILLEIYKEKTKDNNSAVKFNTQFFKIGKGEEYPNKNIDNYQIDDERRRIVVIYWNAIPEL